LPQSLEAAYPLTDVIIVSAGPTIEILPKTFTDQSFISSSAGRVVDRMPTFNPDLKQLNSDSRRACLQSAPGCHDASRRPSQYEATHKEKSMSNIRFRQLRSLTRLILAIAALLLMQITLIAQSDQGRITGTVRDQTGAVIPGATIVVKNERTGDERNHKQRRRLLPSHGTPAFSLYS